MGKSASESKNKDKDGETKVIFKKSNATMFSHSRTFSGASQLYSRSGVLQIRKNLHSNNNYYKDGGKLKRDLSMETDICILRRYYRSKKNRLSTHDGSAKSRYSTLVDTEVETIEEFPDTNGCGDNETESKSNPPLDIASLMIENLKDLLNQWIQKHLLDNKDTKQKIDTVLDTLIQRLDARKNLGSSSASTYVLQKEATSQEVKNKKIATSSVTCQFCHHKARNVKVGSSSFLSQKGSSSATIPFQYKDIRIISTLSIPRSFHKRGLEENNDPNSSWYRMKKIKHKNIILSIDKSDKLTNSSSFDLVAISTKSLTKKCTYDMNVKKKKRHIVFFPKPFYKSATDTSSTTNNDSLKIDINKQQLDEMPSLLKSLYAPDPVIITNIDKNVQYDTKNDTYTMTENLSKEIIIKKSGTTNAPSSFRLMENDSQQGNQNDPVTEIDYIDQRIEFPNLSNPKTMFGIHRKRSKSSYNNKKASNKCKINKRRRRFGYKMTPSFKATKFQNIHNKQFTFLYNKISNRMSQGKDFFKHCQNIMQYFEEYDGRKNIKLDVRINVFPMYESRTKDVCTDVSNQTLGVYEVTSPTLLYNANPTQIEPQVQMDDESIKLATENKSSCEFTADIIPLLDGAVSQAKYIFNENSRDKLEISSKANSLIERSTLTSELEIIQEISELRAVIKDLAAAAERFVTEQLRKESNKLNAETLVSRNPSDNLTSSSKCEVVINLKNPSKAIQYSREFTEKQKLLSGLKLSKEPKRKETFDFYNRLAKKSTSYRIIDSESVLKVTDMTSKANDINEYRVTDEALTCSLPKSRSLFEMTSGQRNKRKLIALFCDGYQNSPQNRHEHCPNCGPLYSSSEKSFKKWTWGKKKARTQPAQKPSCVCSQSHSYSNDSCVLKILPESIDYDRFSSTICFQPPAEAIEQQLSSCVANFRPPTNKCCKPRRGMGFGEGCVYCMLLWIPILIIACLFYGYVLKDRVKFPDEKKVIGRVGPVIRSVPSVRRNSSVLFVKLSDLGF